jgi:hypothetical protein
MDMHLNEAAVASKMKATEEASQRLTQNLNRQVEQAVPMQVVAGPNGPTRNGVARRRAPENPDLLAKVRPFLRKGETLMQFFSRTGISAHQLLTYTHRDLKHLVAVVEGNVAEDTGAIEPKRTPIPSKFYVSVESHQTGLLDAHLQPRLPDNMVDTNELISLYDRLEAARS